MGILPQSRSTPMKKYLLAAVLTAELVVPASAASFYVVFNKTTKTCSIAKSAPTTSERFSMMGI